MIQLPYEDLQKLCRVNLYTKKLCHQQHLWKMRIENENLIYPNIKITNWAKAYPILIKINHIINIVTNMNENQTMDLDVNDQFKVDYYAKIFNQYDEHFEVHEKYTDVKNIIINYFQKDFDIGLVIYVDDNHVQAISEGSTLTKEEFKAILFQFYNDGVITSNPVLTEYDPFTSVETKRWTVIV